MPLDDRYRMRYAAAASPAEVHDGRALTDPAILDLPIDAVFELVEVPLDRIVPETMGDSSHTRSGADWDGRRLPHYALLEQKLSEGEQLPPVVLMSRPDGSFKCMDGYHRVSIARHLGLHALPAYSFDPATYEPGQAAPERMATWDDLPARAEPGQIASLSEELGMSLRRTEAYEMTEVSVADLDGQFGYAMSGREWDDRGRQDNTYQPSVPNEYARMELAMRRGEPLPPISVSRLADGRLALDDGRHRVSIARHIGIKTLPAYQVVAPTPTLSSLDAVSPAATSAGDERLGPQTGR